MVVRMGALLTVLSIVLMACSPATDTSSAETPSTTESPDSATTQPTSSPTPAEVISEISNEEYLAAVASIEDFLDSTSLGFDEGSRASLADFMATVDGVAEAGVSDDGTVWARFTDGREHAVFLNRASGPAAGEDVAVEAAADLTPVAVSAFLAAGGGASLLTAAQAPSGAELPGANTVVIMNGLGNSYDPPPAQLGAWFETKGYGVSSQSPTVDALKSISSAPMVGATDELWTGNQLAGCSPLRRLPPKASRNTRRIWRRAGFVPARPGTIGIRSTFRNRMIPPTATAPT